MMRISILLYLTLFLLSCTSSSKRISRKISSTSRCIEFVENIYNRNSLKQKQKLMTMLEDLSTQMFKIEVVVLNFKDDILKKKSLLKEGEDIKELVLESSLSFKIKEVIKLNNNLVSKLSQVILQAKGGTEILSSEIEFEGIKFSYDVLLLIDLDKSSSEGLRKYARHIERANVVELEIDLFGNPLRGSAGGFVPSESKISLSKNSIIELFKHDQADSIFLHEVTHAYFLPQRISRPSSVYHSRFRSADGEKMIAGEDSIYSGFLSLEELYTYSSQLFWSLSDIKNKKFFNEYSDIQKKFNRYEMLMSSLSDISSLSKKLSKRSRFNFKNLLSSDELGMIKKWRPTGEDVIGIHMYDEVYTERVMTPLDIGFVEEAIKFKELIEKSDIPFFEEGVDSSKLVLSSGVRNAHDRLLQMEKKYYKRQLLKDELIIKVANKLIIESKKITKKIKKLKVSFRKFRNGQINQSEIYKELDDFRQSARGLSLIVRRDNKK